MEFDKFILGFAVIVLMVTCVVAGFSLSKTFISCPECNKFEMVECNKTVEAFTVDKPIVDKPVAEKTVTANTDDSILISNGQGVISYKSTAKDIDYIYNPPAYDDSPYVQQIKNSDCWIYIMEDLPDDTNYTTYTVTKELKIKWISGNNLQGETSARIKINAANNHQIKSISEPIAIINGNVECGHTLLYKNII